MEWHCGNREVRSWERQLAMVSDKAKLVAFLVALAVINMEVEHFRGYGLSGIEMLIGALALTAAMWAYGCIRIYWDDRESREFEEMRGREDQR
jgi:hypothetical protein